MDIEIVKKLIIGTWDMYYQPVDNGVYVTSFLNKQDKYTFDELNETHLGSHVRDNYTILYSIEEKQGLILLKGKIEREVIAISEKCMVWLENSVVYTLLRTH